MYCTKCGEKLEPNERFCPFCGQMVDDAPGQPPVPPPAPSPPSPPASPSAPPPASSPLSPPAPQFPPAQPPIPGPGKKPMGRKVIAAAAAVAVLALIAAAVFLLGGKGKPDDTAESPSPGLSFDPSERPAESTPPSQPLETGEPGQEPVSLYDLYIGEWAAEGCTIGDETNGWMALYVEYISGNAVTFSLEKVQSGPANRIATTYPITVTISDGKGTFPVSDSWGNSGTGTIAVKDGVIHIAVDITSPDPSAMWDIIMDEDFYPASASSQQGQSDQITVMANGSALPLSQAPYLADGQVMIPMEPVFTAMGIAVFEDDGTTVGLTESRALTLTDMLGDYFLDVDGIETSEERSALVSYTNGCFYVPLDTLDVFGLQTSWDPAGKVAAIQGTIAASDRISAQKVEALKGFDMDEAAQRVQNAGFSFAPAGGFCWYVGGCKSYAIPVTTADGIQYAIVSHDGATYQMTVEPAEY